MGSVTAKKVVYKDWTWRAIPLLLKGEYQTLSRPALDLYLTLAFEAAGFARTVIMSNKALMNLSGLTRGDGGTLRAAREELRRRGLITFAKVDKVGREYIYEILDTPPVAAPLPVVSDDMIEVIPRNRLFDVQKMSVKRRTVNVRPDVH